MASIRNQIIKSFAAKIGAERALKFATGDRLPLRVLWDFTEEAERTKYSTHTVVLPVVVQEMIEAEKGQDEGDLLDSTLLALQENVFSVDATLDALVKSITYAGSDYTYSENGSSLVGISASFIIKYEFLTNDPTNQGT